MCMCVCVWGMYVCVGDAHILQTLLYIYSSSVFRYQALLPTIPTLNIPTLSAAHPQCDLYNDDLFLNITTRHIPNHHLDTSRFFADDLPGQTRSSGPTFTATDHASQFNFLAKTKQRSTVNANSGSFSGDFNSHDYLSNAYVFSVIQVIFVVVDIIVLMYRCSRTYTSAKMLHQGFRETKVLEFHKGKANEKLLIIHEHVLRQVGTEPSHNSHSTEEKELSSFEYTNTNSSIPQYSTNDSHRRMLPPQSTTHTTPQHHLNTHVHTNNCAASTTTTGVTSSVVPKSVHVTAIRDEDARKWTQRRRCHYFHAALNIAQSEAIPKILMGVIVFIIFYAIVDLLYLAIDDGTTLAELGAFQVSFGLASHVLVTIDFCY